MGNKIPEKNVLIVEDDMIISMVLERMIGKLGHKVLDKVITGREAIDQTFDLKPDLILMDIQLPGMSGIKGIGLIKDKYSDIDIIMLTVYHDSHKIFNALRAGASGYLLKHTSLPEIKESILKLLDGGAPMSPQIARKVINHFQENAPQKDSDSDLTPREHDIVNGLVDGLSYKMIADRYDISIDTVRAHIRNIYKKLHVNSKAEVIAKSLKGEI